MEKTFCGTMWHQCTAQLTSEAPWNSSYWSYAATYPPAWSAKGTWCSPKQSSEPPVRQAQNWGMVGKLWAALQADYLAILWYVIPSCQLWYPFKYLFHSGLSQLKRIVLPIPHGNFLLLSLPELQSFSVQLWTVSHHASAEFLQLSPPKKMLSRRRRSS